MRLAHEMKYGKVTPAKNWKVMVSPTEATRLLGLYSKAPPEPTATIWLAACAIKALLKTTAEATKDFIVECGLTKESKKRKIKGGNMQKRRRWRRMSKFSGTSLPFYKKPHWEISETNELARGIPHEKNRVAAKRTKGTA
jgi:hypothetical protein